MKRLELAFAALILGLSSPLQAAPRVAFLNDGQVFCDQCAATFDMGTLKDSLQTIYPDLQPVNDMSQPTVAAALAQADVVFVPFIAFQTGLDLISAETRDVLKRFVQGGGKMIVRMHHAAHPFNRMLLESMFSIRFNDIGEMAGATYTCDAQAAMNLGLNGVPASGRAPYYGEFMIGPLPAGAVPICQVGPNQTILAAMPIGDGIVFLEGIYNNAATDYSAEQARLTREMAEVDLVGAHRCFENGGTLKCSGGNSTGQLGRGDKSPHVDSYAALAPVNLGTGFRTARVANSTGSSCAISTDGQLKCWGLNKDGQLGLGDVRPRGVDPTELGDQLAALDLGGKVVDVRVGRFHTCALTDDGKAHCWGKGALGQLGSGAAATVGAAAGDVPVTPDVNGQAKGLLAGRNHTCILRGDSSVVCFGDNALGQLGVGSTIGVGNRDGTMGTALASVDLGAGFKVQKLAGGLDFACALSDQGKIKCWGSNESGQLGQGIIAATRGSGPFQMGDALAFTDLGEKQLATDLQCGFYHCCATTLQNTMKCWGGNDSGQLGLGDTLSRGRGADMGDQLPFVRLPPGERVLGMDLNGNTTCARTVSGTRCWGSNSTGQLATGDKLNRGDKPTTVPRLLTPVF